VRRSSILPLAVVGLVGLIAGTVVFLNDDSPHGDVEHAATTSSLLAIEASGPVHGSLRELIEASELIVRGRVVATSRGRMIGTARAAVESRWVTVEVDGVLRGEVTTPTVLVEEEGWLSDGTPIVVDGLAPSVEGLEAIWFLAAIPDPELPGYFVVNHQGRYVIGAEGALTGAERDDALIAEIERLTVDQLVSAVRSD